jgi:hypothetical protein
MKTLLKKYWNWHFVKVIYAIWILLIAITAVGVAIGQMQTQQTSQDVTSQILNANTRITVGKIFFNNWYLALRSFVPAAGYYLSFHSWFLTGIVLGEEAKVLYPTWWSFAAPFGNAFLYPETFASALIIAESLWLMKLVFKDRKVELVKERLKSATWISVLVSSLLLLGCAAVEYVLIVNGGC